MTDFSKVKANMEGYGFKVSVFDTKEEACAFLAEKAFGDKYDAETLRHWAYTFFKRFIGQQFKRSCLPDGPKVGSVSLSPRGDWRMPSDAKWALFLNEFEERL